MKESKFYFGGFYCLLGLILGLIIGLFVFKTQARTPQSIPKNGVVVVDSDSIGTDKIAMSYTKLPKLNDSNLMKELREQNIVHPKIVLAQAKLETGNYKSVLCLSHNNLFGLRKGDGSYYKFSHWTHSVTAYKKYVQYKYNPPNNYYQFLQDIGYAEDAGYINKVKEIVNQA